MIYICEDDSGVYEVTFPKIPLKFYINELPVIVGFDSYNEHNACMDIKLRYGHKLEAIVSDTRESPVVIEKMLKKKMTVYEIEKELGYEIEIISE